MGWGRDEQSLRRGGTGHCHTGGSGDTGRGSNVLKHVRAVGTVTADGRVATVSVLIGCTAPGSVQFTVTLTQGSTSGVGHGGGRCTGQSETYTVRVPASGGAFTAGSAQACGHAVNQEPGGTQDVRDWCRTGGIALS